ncbi:MAG: gamma-glutamyltransferase, partial [Gemmatimonadetes bacterium]|nr:gamma-glutamyltransferase [Gemmatimonadota bacterium]
GAVNWERLVYPAVSLAGDGYRLTERQARSLERLIEDARSKGYDATVEAFSRSGTPYAPGDVHRQPDLARTLERIMRDGADGFYRGETARLLAAEMRRGGGLITEDDLARYQARERAPIRSGFRGFEIISMPPPSSGGVAVAEMLNILEGFDLDAMGHNSAPYLHHLVEAMRRAYRDRALHLADPDYVDVPVHWLTSEEHAAGLRETIDPEQASTSRVADVAMSPESPETTHYSVVDGDGMAVSVTYTLEQGFGSGITVPGAGFLLNNEMGDFNARPGLTNEQGLIGTRPNLARPGQRMLSSMTPSIVARDGELVAVVGSPGGRTIINTVLQVILNITEFGMGIQEAVDAPRIHHQWLPDVVSLEEEGLPYAIVRMLEGMGHTVRVRGRQGLAHSIMVDPSTGERVGAPDARNPDSGAAGH